MSQQLKQKEEQYRKYVADYYAGTPSIDDDAFDQFQEELIAMGSKLPSNVGYESTITAKFSHITPMLSLSKIKAKKNTEPPTEEFLRWIKKTNAPSYVVEPKFDGNSVNVIYRDGKLWKALSRTDSKLGTDITDVLKHHVPDTIPQLGIIEVRGEMLIKKSIFKKKYSKFANERNYIAGVLHRSNVPQDEIDDLTFMVCDVKLTDGNGKFMGWVKDVNFWCKFAGFNSEMFSFLVKDFNKKSFEEIFYTMLNYRDSKSEYLLDGFVVKVEKSDLRLKLGENDHDPEWAKAIKFEPKGVIAEIIGIEFTLGKKREIIPVAQLKPVQLAGTTVSRCSLYNIGWIQEMKCFPGALVELVKAGDIIPQIISIVQESSNTTYNLPHHCPVCHAQLEKTAVNWYCSNKECSGAGLKKFGYAIRQFGIDFFGAKTIEKIYQGGITNPFDLFNSFVFDKDFLIEIGLGDGVSSDRLISEIKKIKSIPLDKVILGLNIDNCGRSMSKQIALYYADALYDFSGLEKKVIEYATSLEGEKLILGAVNQLELQGINVEYPKATTTNVETFEMTGSPKDIGYKTKEIFFEAIAEFGFAYAPLSNTSKYLLTDSYQSSSGKMAKAKKLGVEILTYEDFLKKHVS